MSELTPKQVTEIRARAQHAQYSLRWGGGYEMKSPRAVDVLMYDVPALCDTIDALREQVKELEDDQSDDEELYLPLLQEANLSRSG